MSDVTQVLNAMEAGDPKAADRLLPLVYEELRRLAAAKMAQESLSPQPPKTKEEQIVMGKILLQSSGHLGMQISKGPLTVGLLTDAI